MEEKTRGWGEKKWKGWVNCLKVIGRRKSVLEWLGLILLKRQSETDKDTFHINMRETERTDITKIKGRRVSLVQKHVSNSLHNFYQTLYHFKYFAKFCIVGKPLLNGTSRYISFSKNKERKFKKLRDIFKFLYKTVTVCISGK